MLLGDVEWADPAEFVPVFDLDVADQKDELPGPGRAEKKQNWRKFVPGEEETN